MVKKTDKTKLKQKQKQKQSQKQTVIVNVTKQVRSAKKTRAPTKQVSIPSSNIFQPVFQPVFQPPSVHIPVQQPAPQSTYYYRREDQPSTFYAPAKQDDNVSEIASLASISKESRKSPSVSHEKEESKQFISLAPEPAMESSVTLFTQEPEEVASPTKVKLTEREKLRNRYRRAFGSEPGDDSNISRKDFIKLITDREERNKLESKQFISPELAMESSVTPELKKPRKVAEYEKLNNRYLKAFGESYSGPAMKIESFRQLIQEREKLTKMFNDQQKALQQDKAKKEKEERKAKK